MRRRALLWILLGTTWAIVSLSFRHVVEILLETFRPRVDTSLPPGALSRAEIDTVLAFAEVLVTERSLSPAERGSLVEHVNDRTLDTLGFLSLYRGTTRHLNRLTSRSFADLPLAERTTLVERLHLADSRVQSAEYLWPFNREALLTRQFVVPDLIAAYYASPSGWAVVGYDTCPGQCGTLTRYTRGER